MEFFQIIFNILFLGALAWWIVRAKKQEVSVDDLNELKSSVSAMFRVVSEIVSDNEKHIEQVKHEKPRKQPGAAYLSAIREGANIAQANFAIGAQTVMDALHRDGRIMAADTPTRPEGAVNIGEEDYEIHNEDPGLPSIIVARNLKMAEQIGDRLTADLMRGMDEKV